MAAAAGAQAGDAGRLRLRGEAKSAVTCNLSFSVFVLASSPGAAAEPPQPLATQAADAGPPSLNLC